MGFFLQTWWESSQQRLLTGFQLEYPIPKIPVLKVNIWKPAWWINEKLCPRDIFTGKSSLVFFVLLNNNNKYDGARGPSKRLSTFTNRNYVVVHLFHHVVSFLCEHVLQDFKPVNLSVKFKNSIKNWVNSSLVPIASRWCFFLEIANSKVKFLKLVAEICITLKIPSGIFFALRYSRLQSCIPVTH